MGAVFLGTPAAAIPSLVALAGIDDVDLVITQPDRRAGRGRHREASPVKTAALQFGFTVQQPDTTDELVSVLEAGAFRFGLVVAYGRLLTPRMLASTNLGFLNVHFSLLPRWRGAAPVERAIEHGDLKTGVTLMKIDEGLDTGPVLAEHTTAIDASETGGSLTARLSFLGARMLDEAIPQYLGGKRLPVPQLDVGTSHAARIAKADARLHPSSSATAAARRVRAFNPRPVAWMATEDGVLRVHRASLVTASVEPGTIVRAAGDDASTGRIIAGFTDRGIALDEVQPEGKPRMTAADWMHGRRNVAARFV